MNSYEYDDSEKVDLSWSVAETGSLSFLTLSDDYHELHDWVTIDEVGYEVENAVYDEKLRQTIVRLVGVDEDCKITVDKRVAVLGNLKKLVNRVMLGLCGQVPTQCTTVNGSIASGDLLVSAPGGMAQKAGENPAPGTILGKAVGSLAQPGEEVVTGKITVLVTLH
jgi:hypothetical protein